MAQPMDMSKRKSGRQKTTDSAKKRRKHVANTAINQQRVYIGPCLERWTAVKDQNGLKTHMEVAMLLLDSYDAYKVMLRRKKLEPLAKSTPKKPETQEEKISHGESSEPVSITGQSEISGLHPISSSEAETHERFKPTGHPQQAVSLVPGFSASFCNPMQ
ncbi:uncharacterized protein LOC127876273 [Dreissena polymorpha]|uniref:uncharacterized protein LOC127876201 n=1 Tax=Dreissena polymorpha TaxID=45954 RepID=UPI0022648931|nr:uncharacterized protein LOC127876201 [Dreissena polymorpha]XP_052277373.1 uncharacterized protein LOC127876273 [Dreissena polymorpha]